MSSPGHLGPGAGALKGQAHGKVSLRGCGHTQLPQPWARGVHRPRLRTLRRLRPPCDPATWRVQAALWFPVTWEVSIPTWGPDLAPCPYLVQQIVLEGADPALLLRSPEHQTQGPLGSQPWNDNRGSDPSVD